jgi:hypothetical protein
VPLHDVIRKPITSVDGQVRLVVGLLVLSSIALAYLVSINWLGLTAFVGFALIVAGFTGVCPMEFFVARCPWNRSATANPQR